MTSACEPIPAPPAILPPRHKSARRTCGGWSCWSIFHVPVPRHELPFLRDDGTDDHFTHEWSDGFPCKMSPPV